jgi:hypothetical protein
MDLISAAALSVTEMTFSDVTFVSITNIFKSKLTARDRAVKP